MSKICKNCSNVLEDDAVFCGNCGAMYEDAAPAEETVAAPAENVPAWKAKLNKVLAKLKLDKVNPKELIVAGCGILVVLILGIVLLTSGGYKSAVKNYQKLLNGNAKVIEKMAPKDYWDEMDIDVDDRIEEYEESYEDMLEYYEEEYGKNVKFKVKVTDKEKMDKDDLKDLAKTLADRYEFIKKKDVKKAFEVELEITIKGSEDKDTQDMDAIAVKIKGKWYLISESGYFYAG